MTQLVLALDFGGTKHTAALAHCGATAWECQERVYAPPGSNADTDVQVVLAMARKLLDGRTPDAVGVSFGGPVDFRTGTVRRSDHVPGWDNVPLARMLTTALGAPAAVDNDANAGAIGEHIYGAGKGRQHLLYVTVSTGVGGGWILDGKAWRGADGLAGEIGHTVIDPEGSRCLCGKHGCVERLASGPFLAVDARAQLTAEPERGAIIRRLAGDDLDAIDARLLSEAAAAGDDVAQEILRRGARALGIGIANAANLVNPQIAVVGGGVSWAGEIWWEALQQAIHDTLVAGIRLDVVPASLGDDAPLWGAFALGASVVEPLTPFGEFPR
jgi:glucokinase